MSLAARAVVAAAVEGETLDALRLSWRQYRELSISSNARHPVPRASRGVGDLPALSPGRLDCSAGRAHGDSGNSAVVSLDVGVPKSRTKKSCPIPWSASRTPSRLPEQGVDLRAHLMVIERSLISRALQRLGHGRARGACCRFAVLLWWEAAGLGMASGADPPEFRHRPRLTRRRLPLSTTDS